MRILVTGSRNWDAPEVIMKALCEAWKVRALGDEFIVVHGANPRGADAAADRICRYFGWAAERHPADWGRYGKSAGPRRNNEMVKAGADVCLAFIRDNSPGASQCARAAEKAGIPVRRYEC